MENEDDVPITEHTGEHVQEHAVDLAHTERLTRLEEHHKQQAEEHNRQMWDMEGRLNTALEESNRARNEEISSLRGEIAALSEKLEKAPEEGITVPETVGGDVAELTVPEIEESPAPPEKERRGVRARRKKRRGNR